MFSSTVSKNPDIIVLDMRPVFYDFQPERNRQTMFYQADSQLEEFMRLFTIKDFIEAIFTAPYENTDPESRIWAFIENKVDESVLTNLSHSTMICIDIMSEFVMETVDDLLRTRMARHNLKANYQDYLFHQWVDSNSAAFSKLFLETGT